MSFAKNKKLVIFIIALLALSSIYSIGIADAKRTTRDVYPGGSISGTIANANAGDTVLVHGGTYDEMVVVSKAVTVIGLDATINTVEANGFYVQAPATISGFKIFSAGNGIYAGGISKIAIKNNFVHSFGIGIWLINVKDVTIQDNTVESTGNAGVAVTAAGNCQITRNTISAGEGPPHNYLTLCVDSSSNVIISENTLINSHSGGSARGLFVNTCNNVLIAANKVTVVEWGVTVYALTNAVITGNEITAGPNIQYVDVGGVLVPIKYASYGIIFADCMFMTISKNIINNAVYSGIWGYRSSLAASCHDVVIHGNAFASDSDGSTVAIRFTGVSKSTIAKNIITGIYAVGISLDSGSSTNTISLNSITKTGGSGMVGIGLDPSTSGNFVKNNKFFGVDIPIDDQGTSNTIVP